MRSLRHLRAANIPLIGQLARLSERNPDRTSTPLLRATLCYTHSIVVVRDDRGDDGHDEGDQSQDGERDGVSPADVVGYVDHGGRM